MSFWPLPPLSLFFHVSHPTWMVVHCWDSFHISLSFSVTFSLFTFSFLFPSPSLSPSPPIPSSVSLSLLSLPPSLFLFLLFSVPTSLSHTLILSSLPCFYSFSPSSPSLPSYLFHPIFFSLSSRPFGGSNHSSPFSPFKVTLSVIVVLINHTTH